jgi:protein tyrosine phosphatase (PTP) superfamily phosphohydrolase (DUF442 family)
MTKRRRFLVWSLGAIALALAPCAGYLAWDQATDNFGQVSAGVFRSGQMRADALANTLKRHAIRTVINLRGPNEAGWYQAEKAATLAAGATQIDIPMSSCLWMTREQFRTLVELLSAAERPLLIHCSWGSERTGLASAVCELLRPGGTIASARAQFSLAYLYAPLGDGKVMGEHLEAYASWLERQHLRHQPAIFLHFVNEVYEPRGPNSGQWPYNPYPLAVISRPGESPIVRAVAANPAKTMK